MSAELTTHVLDTGREGPAEGVEVTLQRLDGDGPAETIAQGTTNDDGRLNEPLLTESQMEAGTYQLLFDVGAYYRQGPSGSTFLETVPVRFVIDDANDHYHVPLLLSPGGYTTYRGS
ncbi:5-hydroxyisourate hydrolase [Halohasta litchfieldiae]|jgi:5-hydroxyisourate hydrolase|uniref:hydroxyisourate hydrolase n=1 Tax=Halohasta litchfieldiae TaxID=1073996 RepID=A0A1H6S4Q0_9EURY|nr:hydroxyisourate hydrolase [Halohasta litchfieldiae]ATW89339.1 5-hydroxyisourate hydrolase [Halohasta litchfieldiae]SEI59757.1 5-hydroxyisourate hydrolase [Halohasta litchfieldiae]